MSGSQYHRSSAVNESNIPIPKRTSVGIKNSKRCAQLPELQRYIETIIKASNECDSEDTSLSDRDRFPKERKYGRYSVSKGIENKTKNEKMKNDFNMNRSKNYIKPKTPVKEVVSRGVQINSNSLAPEFEDPRNWNNTKTQNLGPSVEIEKFLKQFYPNPYHLENVNEFKDTKIDEKDHLRDGTLPDVVISKANIHIEVDIQKTDNDLETADLEIKPCNMENKHSNLSPDPKSEKCDKSPTQSNNNNNNDDSKATRTSSQGKIGNFMSNTSSQDSSAESLSKIIRHKEGQMNFKKRKNVKPKNRIKPLKSDAQNDYDIGKLKLLSLTDSDDSLPKEGKTKIKDTDENDMDAKSSSNSEEKYKTEELNDLKEIYDMMYKATESFLYISSKSEPKGNNITENHILSEPLKNEGTKFCAYDNDIRLSTSDHSGIEIYPKIKEKAKGKSLTEFTIDKTFENEKSTFGKSLINVLLKEDKFEFITGPEYTETEQEQGPVQVTITVEEQVQQQDQQQVQDQVNDQVQEQAPDQVQYQVQEQVPKQIQEQVQKQIQEQIPKQIPKQEQEQEQVQNQACNFPNNFEETLKPKVLKEEEENNYGKGYDEVLEYMYDCLKKFNDNKKHVEENLPKDMKPPDALKKTITCRKFGKGSGIEINLEKPATSDISKETDFTCMDQKHSVENLIEENFIQFRSIQNKYVAALGEINKKSGNKTRCHRRPLHISRDSSIVKNNVNELPATISERATASHTNMEPESYREITAEVNENIVVAGPITVERQNELGGCAEEVQTTEDVRIPKPVLPLSVKRKKSKMSTSKTLKDVLEAEEKLLSVEYDHEKTESEEPKGSVGGVAANKTADLTKAFSKFKDFTHSNFSICLNSFPRTRKSLTSIKPTVSVSASLGDVKKAGNFREDLFCPQLPLRKISLPQERQNHVLTHNYIIQQEISRTFHKTNIMYTAQTVCQKLITNIPNLAGETPLKTSECMIQIIIKPVEESFFVESENALISCSENRVNTDDNKPVEALIEAIQDTEEKVFLLEKRADSTENLYSRNSEIFNPERLRCEMTENEVGRMNDKKKIHELLLRTYNLQQKLQQYLQKIISSKPSTLSCPLMQHNTVVDANVTKQNKVEFEVKPNSSLPVVHWHMQTVVSDAKSKMDESVTVNVSMVDRGTSYDPPPVEQNCEKEESNNEATSPKFESAEGFSENRNDEDDRSSTYSFKSSNDFSEKSETQIPNKDTNESDETSKKYYKKIFNEIEQFRQSFEADKMERQQQETSNSKESRESTAWQLAQYDPKIPAKVLKTVFKGKKSLTELTIGLKDVPMTKVGNISVEKTKFSPNHTKISISISKESSESSHTKLPSYYFDHMRPSLSSGLTDYSRLKDNDSKTSQSLNQQTDDEDEDDYKSVGSTFGNSDSELEEEEKMEPKEEKIGEKTPPPPKSFTKHKFDFYRKMTTDCDSNRSKQKSLTNSVCRYKELEPLKEALTEMQIRMRNIKREAGYDSNDYFERALKLAKMSAGFCQNCGNRAVIPNDTFGYYRTLLPRRYSHQRRNRQFRPNPSIYSLQSSDADINDQLYDLGLKRNSYLLNPTIHSNRTVLRTSMQDMPILFERM